MAIGGYIHDSQIHGNFLDWGVSKTSFVCVCGVPLVIQSPTLMQTANRDDGWWLNVPLPHIAGVVACFLHHFCAEHTN